MTYTCTHDMELEGKAPIEIHYTYDPGEKGQYHDGNGFGRPDTPPGVIIDAVFWVKGPEEKVDVTDLILDQLGYRGGLEDECLEQH